jgi:hypothetical protein
MSENIFLFSFHDQRAVVESGTTRGQVIYFPSKKKGREKKELLFCLFDILCADRQAPVTHSLVQSGLFCPVQVIQRLPASRNAYVSGR